MVPPRSVTQARGDEGRFPGVVEVGNRVGIGGSLEVSGNALFVQAIKQDRPVPLIGFEDQPVNCRRPRHVLGRGQLPQTPAGQS